MKHFRAEAAAKKVIVKYRAMAMACIERGSHDETLALSEINKAFGYADGKCNNEDLTPKLSVEPEGPIEAAHEIMRAFYFIVEVTLYSDMTKKVTIV